MRIQKEVQRIKRYLENLGRISKIKQKNKNVSEIIETEIVKMP